MNHLYKPKLRNISAQRLMYQGQPVFVIQDGLKLTETAVIVPQSLGPLLMLCDGEHTLPEIAASLEVRHGLRLPLPTIEEMLAQFDQALLLEGETFKSACQQAVKAYREAPFRPPALVDGSYPGDPDALRHMLQQYSSGVNGVEPVAADSRGLISPHIDYQRGGPTYARLWISAAEAVRQAELVIIFGTDHNGGFGTLTLTEQNYASPLGVMPTDRELVRRLANDLGPAAAFDEELHHRGEHSIELALVWLQYIRDGEPCPLAPVLCGSYHLFMTGQANIDEDSSLKRFIETLREETGRRRTLVVAAGDLAHLGPAFDGPPLDLAAQAQMKSDDEILIDNICQGNAASFFELMQAGQYQRNVCGLSPFYLTLSVLGETHGRLISYDRCPADHNGTSYVSVCGLVFD